MRVRLIFTVVAALPVFTAVETARADTSPERSHRGGSPTLALSLGPTTFVNREMRAAFPMGLAWAAKAGIGPTEEVRLEVSYTGSSQELAGVRDRTLGGHGVQAALRINIGPELTIEPILVVGAGWTRFAIDGSQPPPGVPRIDHVLELPLSAGAVYRSKGFVFDARATFTIVSGADLIPEMDPTTSQNSETMHRVTLSIGVGYQL